MEKHTIVETTDERTPFIEQSQKSKVIEFYRRHKIPVTAAAIMVLLLPLLGLLALRNRGARAEWTSPLVYPSRKSTSPTSKSSQ
jgi:beta-glucosidase